MDKICLDLHAACFVYVYIHANRRASMNFYTHMHSLAKRAMRACFYEKSFESGDVQPYREAASH